MTASKPHSPVAASARFDAAMAAAGFGHYQLSLAVVPCSMLATNSATVALISVLRTKAVETLTAGGSRGDVVQAETLVPMVSLVGVLVGSTCFGWLSDHHGRRRATIVCGACVFLGLGVISLAPTLATLYVGLALCGVAGGGQHVGQTLLAEFVPPAHRERIVAIYASFWTTGLLLMSVWYALVVDTPLGSWRNLALACAVPNAFAALYAWRRLAESPRYLLSVGRHSCADNVLHAMAKANGTSAATAAAFADHDEVLGANEASPMLPDACAKGEYGTTRSLTAAAAPPHTAPPTRQPWFSRFRMILVVPSVRAVTLRLIGVWLATTAAYYAVLIDAPSLGATAEKLPPVHDHRDDAVTARHGTGRHLSPSSTASLAQAAGASAARRDASSARWMVIQALAEYPAYVMQYLVSHNLSRRAGLSLCTVLAGAAGLAWSWSAMSGLRESGAALPTAALLFVAFRLLLLTLFNLLWLVTPEAYPTNLRSTGCGCCASVSGVAGAASPLLLLLSSTALSVAAAVGFAVALACAWTLPNTARQPLVDFVRADASDGGASTALQDDGLGEGDGEGMVDGPRSPVPLAVVPP